MVSLAESAERLLLLATFLEDLHERDPGRFRFDSFVGYGWNGDPDLSCGTTACALGWASTMPVFRELGLRLSPLQPGVPERGAFPVLVDADGNRIGRAYDACRVIFGLTWEETDLLFFPPSSIMPRFPVLFGGRLTTLPRDASARDVAQNIRLFVAEREMQPNVHAS